MQHVFASAIGSLLATVPGLSRLVLPSTLPGRFRAEVAEACNAVLGYRGAIIVGDPDQGEITAGEAIAFRTPEESANSTVVLVSTTRHYRELKSLEAFRDVLANGLPGKLFPGQAAIIDIDAICAEASRGICQDASLGADEAKLANAFVGVTTYLAQAYESFGNGGTEWTDAFWRHLDRLGNGTASALGALMRGLPGREHLAVHMAAGLPKPANASAFQETKHGPGRYADIIRDRWASQDGIKLALEDIIAIDMGDPSASHPLATLEWETIATTHIALQHPMLATAYHSVGDPVSKEWLDAWASTSEDAFFSERKEQEVAIQLDARLAGGGWESLAAFPWQGVDFVLPVPANKLGDDRRISLGSYKLGMATVARQGPDPAFKVEVSPKSAATVADVQVRRSSGGVEIEFSLSRKVAPKGGKWREKPLVVSVRAMDAFGRAVLREPLSLRCVVPHPARPTIFIGERKGAKGKPKAKMHPDTVLELSPDGDRVLHLPGDTPDIALDDRRSSYLVAIASRDEVAPRWEDGGQLEPVLPGPGSHVAVYSGIQVPETAVVVAGEFGVSVDYPVLQAGRFGPIVAAITADPLVAMSSDVQASLERDPRSVLEEWYAAEAVRTAPSSEFRQALGIAVLSSSGASTHAIAWNATRRLFTDIGGNFNLKFPAVPDTSALDAFWAAFDALALKRLVANTGDAASWPSALDLRSLERGQVEAYLAAYEQLLAKAAANGEAALFAYPFSGILYDTQRGLMEGVLLSPLHPVRLAWNWSVQVAATALKAAPGYGDTSPRFLRFIDGENLPFVGPGTDTRQQLLSLGLASRDEGFFAGWSLLAKLSLHVHGGKAALELLGRRLPLRAPSGLDSGGVSSALRDYLRVFPSAPQLRIALASSTARERSMEIDHAVVVASSQLLAHASARLPGGIRVLDSISRLGTAPDANSVLRQLAASRDNDPTVSRPRAFEWVSDASGSHADVRFMEDALVDVEVWQSDGHEEPAGCVGPSLPINRFSLWNREQAGEFTSAIPIRLAGGSYDGVEPFERVVTRLESIADSSRRTRVGGRLLLGADLMADSSRWTITGNRYVDPAILGAQLNDRAGDLMLWEWRPAFLAREDKGSAIAISSSHPYTVLARPSSTLKQEIADTLAASVPGVPPGIADSLLAQLGMRGIGLSSLLAMGQTHHVGAIGFYLAFEALRQWEKGAGANELRCIVPIDALYPLLELLAPGVAESDSQRRADLLLLAATIDGDTARLELHPIEVKNRTSNAPSFPPRDNKQLRGYEEQLITTQQMLARLIDCYNKDGRDLALVNAAMATFVEAALSLRPSVAPAQGKLDLSLLRAAATGKLDLRESVGVLLWFQSGGVASTGADFEARPGLNGAPATLLANPKAILGASNTSAAAALAALLGGGLSGPPVGERQPPAAPPPQLPAPAPTGREATRPEGNAIAAATAGEPGAAPLPGAAPIPGAPGAGPDGIEILVGHLQAGGEQRAVVYRPSDTALSQLNMGVIGDVGAGKTQFLQSVLYQMASSAPANRGIAPKVFIFDYKKDYTKNGFPGMIDAVVLEPGRTPMPLNFFALAAGAGRLEMVRRASFFRDILRRIANIGEVQSNRLYECIMEAYRESPDGYWPNLDGILDRYKAMVGAKSDSVVSVLRMLVDLQVFESDARKVARFEELFKRSIVLDLSGLSGAGEKVEHIVATIFLDFLYTDYMKNLRKPDFTQAPDGTGRRFVDSIIVIDEAHHAMSNGFDVLMKLLLEGREFGMGVILSSQYLSHFNEGGKNWSEPLSTWMVHNVRESSRQDFDKMGFRGDTAAIARSASTLAPHWGFYRCAHGFNEGVLIKGQPFYSLKRQ